MPLTAGARLGPYEVVSVAGAGGMGEVYRARDIRLDRTVAIKVLPPQVAGDLQFRERFDREARVISRLAHANICTLYDVGDAESAAPGERTKFLVMDYDVTPDGKGFILVRPSNSGERQSIVVVTDWFEEMRAKMGAAR